LRADGFGWRKAVFVAWASSPRGNRKPPTVAELARLVLGVSPRTVRNWRANDPSIDEAVAIYQAAPLMRHRRDVFDALVTVAADPSPAAHADRRLFLEMTGDYTPRAALDHRAVVAEVTAEDLEQAALELAEFEAGLADE
jgi:hypothetical protein